MNWGMRLAPCAAMIVMLLACSSQPSSTVPPSPVAGESRQDALASPEVIRLQLSCLLEQRIVQQVEICSAAINSGRLQSRMLSDALAVRGVAYMRLLKFSDARIDLEEAKRLNPANPLIDRGLELLKKGEQAIDANDGVQTALDCRDIEEPKTRLTACDRFVEQTVGRPRDQALAYDARAFVKLGQRDTAGALEDLDKAAVLAPDGSEIEEHRLWALFMHGDYRAALPGLEERLAADPYNDVLKTMVATVYYVEGDKQRALDEFDAMRLWERRENLPAARSIVIRLEQRVSRNPFEDLKWRPAQRWLGILVRYRMSEISEEEFRADMPIFVPTENSLDACLTEFHVAHKAALAGDTDSALLGFGKAINVCGIGEFEYHAAKAWLRKLGR